MAYIEGDPGVLLKVKEPTKLELPRNVAVVSRKLDTTWYVSGVYPIPNGATDLERRSINIIEDERDRLITQFPEFRSAEWKCDVVQLHATVTDAN